MFSCKYFKKLPLVAAFSRNFGYFNFQLINFFTGSIFVICFCDGRGE